MKKTLISIFSFIILTFFAGSSQAVDYPGDYTIDNIDTSGDIAGLAGYTGVDGTLKIISTTLTDLSGLENITNVGALYISINAALTSLGALSKLTSVSGDLIIQYNHTLTSLSGLNNITRVGVDLYINNNDALTSLGALSNLTRVGESLDIIFNDALTSLNGLDNITYVGGTLRIAANAALTSLNGLDNITNVGTLHIGSNETLTNLCALYNVNLNSAYTLQIYDNTLLSMDTAYALETQLRSNGFTGTAYIHDNNGSGLVSCDLEEPSIYGNVSGSCGGPALKDVYMLLYRESCYHGYSLCLGNAAEK